MPPWMLAIVIAGFSAALGLVVVTTLHSQRPDDRAGKHDMQLRLSPDRSAR